MSSYYDQSEFLAVFFAAFFVIMLVTVILSYVIMGFSLMVFFSKIGVEPWKAWVPFYSTYTWLRVGGQSGHWVWLSLVPYGSLVTSIFLYIGMYRTGLAFDRDAGFLVLGIFFPFVWLLILGLGSSNVYRPEVIAARGYAGPFEGLGAVMPPQPSY